jgi:hypothetical protein
VSSSKKKQSQLESAAEVSESESEQPKSRRQTAKSTAKATTRKKSERQAVDDSDNGSDSEVAAKPIRRKLSSVASAQSSTIRNISPNSDRKTFQLDMKKGFEFMESAKKNKMKESGRDFSSYEGDIPPVKEEMIFDPDSMYCQRRTGANDFANAKRQHIADQIRVWSSHADKKKRVFDMTAEGVSVGKISSKYFEQIHYNLAMGHDDPVSNTTHDDSAAQIHCFDVDVTICDFVTKVSVTFL